MDDLIAALDALADELSEARELVNTRHLEGGQPLVDFLDQLDELFPELAAICDRVWMLELVVSLCKMRRPT